MAPGSRLVLNYQAEVPLSEAQIDYLKTVAASTRAGGEPWQSRWKTEDFEQLIVDCGLRIVERASEDDLNRRYFSGRTDGMYAGVPARLITAEKAG